MGVTVIDYNQPQWLAEFNRRGERIAELEAERDRLREALQIIASGHFSGTVELVNTEEMKTVWKSDVGLPMTVSEARDIARKALKRAGNVEKILDACCGSRMFWFNKKDPRAVFMDIRRWTGKACDGRNINVDPDVIGDFRNIPFADESFRMVVFDPPHLLRAGESSWLAQKYGKLNKETWRNDLKQGFDECFRVLEPGGFLIFKWNEDQVKVTEVAKLFPVQPLFGQKGGKTHWLVFMKEGAGE